MKQYVLSSQEFDNGLFLMQKGMIKVENLPNDKISGLTNQGLASVDSENVITLTENGFQYFEDYLEQEKEIEAEQEEVTQEALESLFLNMRIAKECAILDSENVALESISDVLAKTMPGLVNGLTGIINSIRPTDPALTVKLDKNAVEKGLSKTPYLDLAELPIPVPQGLKVTYLKLISTLEEGVTRIEAIDNKLEEFTSYVANVLTNSEARLDTQNRDNYYRELQTQRDVIYAGIGACFNTTGNTKIKFSNLVERNADWATVNNQATDLANRLNKINRSQLLKKAKHLNSLLVKVRDNARNGGFTMTSPEVVRSLAEGSFQMASELELYSVMYYRVTGLVTNLSQANELLKKALTL